MPNLTIKPVLEREPGGSPPFSIHRVTDSHVKGAYGTAPWGLDLTVGAASLHWTVDAPTGREWVNVDVTLPATLDGVDVARINRLLQGTGIPRLEWYHRTKSLALRAKGHALELPLAVSATKGSAGWAWGAHTPTGVSAGFGASPRIPHAAAPTVAATPAATAVAAKNPILAAAGVAVAEAATAEVVIEVTDTPKPVKVDAKQPPMADPLGIFTFPTPSKEGEVVVTSEVTKQLQAAWDDHTSGMRQVIALFGPTGTGKTSLVYDFAAKHGIGVFQFDAAGASTFIDWVGATMVRESNGASVTEYAPSSLIEAIRADGQYAGKWRIILVDEVNRAESAAATNFLMTMTHGIAGVYVPDARMTIPVDPAAMVIYTGNIGSAYNATVPLDPALVDRIDGVIHLDYPDEETEKRILNGRVPGLRPEVVTALVNAAKQTRVIADRGDLSKGVSTRGLIKAAYKIKRGLTPLEAATLCWVNPYSAEGGESSDRAVVRNAIEAVLRGMR